VTGAEVALAVSHPLLRTQTLTAGDGRSRPALIRLDTRDARAGSVALRFADGAGTVVAGLRGFVANVVVDEGRVVDVSYIPASGTSDRSMYESERARVDSLHAAVATAARFGVFRIEGGRTNREQAARQLADRIRVLKGIDPTLGLYAAYAYSDAGLPNQVQSVRDFMRGDLGVDLFDVAMLAGGLTGRSLDGPAVTFPFCPMLAQGWSLIRVKDVRLAREVNEARDHLRQSLWTTFDREGIEPLMEALREGRLR
jgi:hypothetical protein